MMPAQSNTERFHRLFKPIIIIDMEQIDLNKVYAPQIASPDRLSRQHKQAVRLLSPTEFESFVFEWLKYCRYKNQDISVFRIGGPYDQGVDIWVKSKDERIVYQCKRYEKPLSPSEVKTAIVKVLWYAFLENPEQHPSSIVIVSASDYSRHSIDLWDDREQLRKSCLLYLSNALKAEKIDPGKEFPAFEKYARSFDYETVKYEPIETIIIEYHDSDIGYLRFNDVKRKVPRVPVDQERIQTPFIEQVQQALTLSDRDEPGMKAFVEGALCDFYTALSLKETCLYLFGTYEEFQRIENTVSGLFRNNDFSDFKNGYERMRHILDLAASANTGDSFLDSDLHIVTYDDRKGACHILVNNDEQRWAK